MRAMSPVDQRQLGVTRGGGEGGPMGVAGSQPELLAHVLDQLAQREGLAVRCRLAGLQLGQLEELVDQTPQALAVGQRHGQVLAALGLVELVLP